MQDAASVLKPLNYFLLISLACLSIAPLAKAAPAVSAPNAWVDASASLFDGNRNSGRSGLFSAGIAAPLSYNLGIQGAAAAGNLDHNNYNALDGLLFWRDPVQGSLGLHLAFDRTQDVSQTYAGVKGEIYDRSFTYGGEVGTVRESDDNNQFYGQALVRWYANPNLALQAAYTHVDSDNLANVGVEYQLNMATLNGLSVFADAGMGSHDYSYGLLGLKYYFGCGKELICRHRYDMIPTSLDLLPIRQLQSRNPIRNTPYEQQTS